LGSAAADGGGTVAPLRGAHGARREARRALARRSGRAARSAALPAFRVLQACGGGGGARALLGGLPAPRPAAASVPATAAATARALARSAVAVPRIV
jgi:hypothetical protein